MAPNSHLFLVGGIVSRLWFSLKLGGGGGGGGSKQQLKYIIYSYISLQEKQTKMTNTERCETHLFRALSISMVTRTERAIVMGWRSSNTLQETPEKTALSAVHCMWWLCGKVRG